MIGGNLRDVMGIDKLVAFFARDPVREGPSIQWPIGVRDDLTLTELETTRVSDNTRTPQAAVMRGGEKLLSILTIIPNQVWRRMVSRSELE